MFEANMFEATFSGVSYHWEVVTEQFRIFVRNLSVIGMDGLKVKYHKVTCEACSFHLDGDSLIVDSYEKIKTSSLW